MLQLKKEVEMILDRRVGVVAWGRARQIRESRQAGRQESVLHLASTFYLYP